MTKDEAKRTRLRHMVQAVASANFLAEHEGLHPLAWQAGVDYWFESCEPLVPVSTGPEPEAGPTAG